MDKEPQDDGADGHARSANRRSGAPRRERDRNREQLFEEMADRYERDLHVREWWTARWKCFWGILAKLGLILALAGPGVDLAEKLWTALAPQWATPVDRRSSDRPPYRGPPSRGH